MPFSSVRSKYPKYEPYLSHHSPNKCVKAMAKKEHGKLLHKFVKKALDDKSYGKDKDMQSLVKSAFKYSSKHKHDKKHKDNYKKIANLKPKFAAKALTDEKKKIAKNAAKALTAEKNKLANNITRRCEQISLSLQTQEFQNCFSLTQPETLAIAKLIETDITPGSIKANDGLIEYYSKKKTGLKYSLEYFKKTKSIVLLSDKKIGEGGFKKARDAALTALENYTQPLESVVRLVSKNIIKEKPADNETKQEFKDETKLYKKFKNCPGIVSILGERRYAKTIQFQGNDLTVPKQSLVFKRADMNLFEKLNKGELSFTDQLQVAYDLVLGLQALHKAGLAHNDLKAENVLLKGNRAYLTDFGHATKDKNIDSYGTQVMTPPELLGPHRLKETDAKKADIWALGTIFYETTLGNEDPDWYDNCEKELDISKYVDDIQEEARNLEHMALSTALTPIERFDLLTFKMLNYENKRVSLQEVQVELEAILALHQNSNI
jgi:tRNA A-37 threonylcarbamoyl transferase component Bud32